MKKVIIIFSIIILLGFVYFGYRYQNSFGQQITIKSGQVVQKVSETGRLVSNKEYNLAYNVSGEIKSIPIEVGQLVKQGDALIELDKVELEIALNQARANKQTAQSRLNQLLAGAKQEDVQVYKASLNSAQTGASNAQTTVDNAEISLEDIQTNLANTKSEAERNLAKLYAGIANILNNAYIKADDAVRKQTEEMFTNDSSNDPQLNFQTADTQAERKIEVQRFAIGKDVAKFKIELDNLTADEIALDSALIKTENHLKAVADFLNRLTKVVGSALDLSDSTISNYKGYLNIGQTNINSVLTEVNNQQQAILSQQIINQSKIDAAKEKVNQAKALLKTAQGGLSEAEAVVQKAEKQLIAIKADPRAVDQDVFYSQVVVAQSKIELLQKRLADTQLKAPSDGVITRIEVEEGERIAPQQVLVSIIGQARFELEIYIAEENILKIQPQQKVEFSLDAFPKGEKFTAKIISIEPAATIIEAEVYYKVKAEILEDISGALEGMTADVDIIIASRDNVVRVPAEAVEELANKQFVWVVDGNFKKEKRQIQIGLVGDVWLEVVSGLSDNDKILRQ